MKLGTAILDLLFPPRCLFCNKLLPEGQRELCESCRKQVQVENLRREGRDFGLCVSVFSYAGEVREAILRFKFGGLKVKARPFGEYLAQTAAEELSGQFDLVTWVPVHPLRRFLRGYDQAQLLAQETCRLWQVKPQALLAKKRYNRPNSSLQQESSRRANVLGAYRVIHPELVAGKRILLVDDVITTGSTLGECARMLKDCGAESVVCLTLASARGKGDRR